MRIRFSILMLSFFSMAMQAQTPGGLPSGLSSALGKGDVPGIAVHLSDKVELTIGDQEDMLPKASAENRLRTFFGTNAAKGFKAMHAGNSRTQSSNYFIGELTTSTGSYRVFIYLTDNQKISELRIEH